MVTSGRRRSAPRKPLHLQTAPAIHGVENLSHVKALPGIESKIARGEPPQVQQQGECGGEKDPVAQAHQQRHAAHHSIAVGKQAHQTHPPAGVDDGRCVRRRDLPGSPPG